MRRISICLNNKDEKIKDNPRGYNIVISGIK